MRAIERASDVRSSFVATRGPKLTLVRGVPLDCLFRGDIMSPSDAPGIKSNTTLSVLRLIIFT